MAVYAVTRIKAELFSKATDFEEETGKGPKSKNATAHVPGEACVATGDRSSVGIHHGPV